MTSLMHPANKTRLPAVIEAPSREVYTMEDLGKMAQHVAASGMFGLNQSQAFTLMLLCESEGLHPIQAVRRYHIIQGRPTMRADAMLAEMLARGWIVVWADESLDGDTLAFLRNRDFGYRSHLSGSPPPRTGAEPKCRT